MLFRKKDVRKAALIIRLTLSWEPTRLKKETGKLLLSKIS